MILTTLTAFIVACTTVLLVLNFNTGEKHITQQMQRAYSTADPQFMRAMGSLLGPGISSGNKVTGLLNGDQIFPSMLQAINGAPQSITVETYIYWAGDIGRQFADALSAWARVGVRL